MKAAPNLDSGMRGRELLHVSTYFTNFVVCSMRFIKTGCMKTRKAEMRGITMHILNLSRFLISDRLKSPSICIKEKNLVKKSTIQLFLIVKISVSMIIIEIRKLISFHHTVIPRFTRFSITRFSITVIPRLTRFLWLAENRVT